MPNPTHILITGAAGGLGAALAKTYSAAGVHLSLLGRKIDELNKVANTCRRLSASASVYVVDVAQTEILQKTLNDIDDEKPVDLLIVNAGAAHYLTKDNPVELWDETTKVLDVNVIGALATISPLMIKMRRRQRGQIALISSMAAFYGLPVTPAYSASKAALKAYGESLRGLLRDTGVKISVVFPGFVQSKMSAQFLCKKPFLMTPDKAACIIKSGLEKNKARIAFPFLLHIGMRLLTILPCCVSDFFLSKLNYKI